MTLEPLGQTHLEDLWAVVSRAPQSFTYLRYGPFDDQDALRRLIEDLSTRSDQPFWAVLGPEGTAMGWLSMCDVYPEDGAFEIGSIWFSPELQGTRMGREAIFLLMCYGMDALEYERLVWRCQAQNEASFRAALNLGFTHEGTWRNAAVVKGWQRDIAWFSILKEDWALCRKAFEIWFLDGNFDGEGRQVETLQDIRERLS
ncbi:GNAT family protein [Amylibacter sp. IMCC11727]|uniref:GNAT family N-acetyltransferase n=1 Tax=Amylibacter sp. IMCC11727 TaxID=3039851 RepID=UPI00244D9DEC|nr:GNAT family protein [Amylibacter sp. IMCC11727]WGI20883.1 GNAT family protein [Amylibacter sp. IMCC11727]